MSTTTKNIRYQDPYSFITRLIERQDGAPSKLLEGALESLKRGKPDEATAALLTLPDSELALGCVVTDETSGELVPDEGWIPEFIKAAKAKAKKPTTTPEKTK